MTNLAVKIGSLELKNPVMTGSGTFGFGQEYAHFFPLEKLGAIVVKGVATFPSHGNKMPRCCEVTSGMMNAIGLQGPGIDKFITDEHYLPFLRTIKCPVIVNIWGKSVEQYAEVARRLEEVAQGNIAALEINISCPNVKEGGISFGQDEVLAAEVVRAVKEQTTLPLITKMSPTAPSIPKFAQALEAAGTDMISLINTIPAMAIDIETRKPKIANVTGGLSGPCLKPIAIRMVYEASRAVKIPVIGMGGIMDGNDAIEFMLVGASAVAVGTANFVDPYAPVKVVDGIKAYLERHGIKDVNEIIGKVEI